MDHKKAKASLEKLNVLFNSVQNSSEDISAIEKDLLLSYIRKLYDAVLQGDLTSIHAAIATSKKPTKKKSKKKKIMTTAPSKDPKVENKVAPEVVEEKKVEVVEEKIEVLSSTPEKAGSDKNEPSSVQPEQVDERLKELFNIQEATELSEKLSQMPIKDLSKSMGINEKIFTVQELFGGNQDLFNSCIETLNACDNFEEAKKYLATGVAKDNDWGSEDKLKKAVHFIKLVHRRYQ